MAAPLRIILTPEEDRTLTELRLAQSLPQRTRDRAHMLRLNAQGWNVPAIAKMFECHAHTVRATLRRWELVRQQWIRWQELLHLAYNLQSFRDCQIL